MARHDAAHGFDVAADEYERGRPSYPEAALDCLADECRIRPSSTVVELGAGTGKLTKQLWRRAAKWIAVEPSGPMRTILEETLPQVDAVDGTAESIPLPDSSCDVVVVAQAFHWFRGVEALAEIKRVLRPQGKLGLIWNVRDDEEPWVAELSRILSEHEGSAPRYARMDWRRVFTTTTLFTPLNDRSFPYRQEMDADGLVDRVTSISFIALLPEDEKAAVVDRVRALVADKPGYFDLPYLTDVYWCTRR